MSIPYLKPGVRLDGMTPQALFALLVAGEVYEAHGLACRVTSVYRPEAMLHTTGNAVDLGIRDLNGDLLDHDIIDSLVDSLTARLGRKAGLQWDVVDERHSVGGPHLHLEFDPK